MKFIEVHERQTEAHQYSLWQGLRMTLFSDPSLDETAYGLRDTKLVQTDTATNSFETFDNSWRNEVRIAQQIRAHGDAITEKGSQLRDEARRLVARSRSARSELSPMSRIDVLRRASASRRRQRTLTRDAATAIAVARAERDAAVAALMRARKAMEAIAESMAGNRRKAPAAYSDAD